MTSLTLYVAYDHPRDFPRHIVVREQRVPLHDEPTAAFTGCLYDTFAEAQAAYAPLVWLPRYPGDDPVILGVWL